MCCLHKVAGVYCAENLRSWWKVVMCCSRKDFSIICAGSLSGKYPICWRFCSCIHIHIRAHIITHRHRQRYSTQTCVPALHARTRNHKRKHTHAHTHIPTHPKTEEHTSTLTHQILEEKYLHKIENSWNCEYRGKVLSCIFELLSLLIEFIRYSCTQSNIRVCRYGGKVIMPCLLGHTHVQTYSHKEEYTSTRTHRILEEEYLYKIENDWDCEYGGKAGTDYHEISAKTVTHCTTLQHALHHTATRTATRYKMHCTTHEPTHSYEISAKTVAHSTTTQHATARTTPHTNLHPLTSWDAGRNECCHCVIHWVYRLLIYPVKWLSL